MEDHDRYKRIFDAAEVSIWEEDFTALNDRLEKLRADGVSDLHRHLTENTSIAWNLAASVKVVDVNSATLKMFNAASKEDFRGSIHLTFTTATLKAFINAVCALWSGETYFRQETSMKRFDGSDIDVSISLPIPKTRADLERVPVAFADISNTKFLYRELEKSEAELREIIEKMPDIFYRTDQEGRITLISPSAQDIIGLKPKDLIGRKITDFYVNPDDRNLMLAKLMENPGEAIIFEAHLRKADGAKAFISTKSRLRLDASGRPIGVEGIARDITNFKKLTTELKRSEKRLRTAIDGAPIILFALDQTGRYTLAEGNGLTSMGLKPGELVGQSIFELYSSYPFIENIRKAIVGEVVEYEALLNERVYHTVLTPIVDEGNQVGVIGVSTDITERKNLQQPEEHGERAYRELFENSKAIELLIDPSDGKIVDGNALAREFYGYSRQQIQELHTFDINAMPQKMLQREMVDAMAEKRNIFRFKHKVATGQLRDVEVHAGPVSISGRSLLHSIIFDITERREAEDALQTLFRAVEQSPDSVMITDQDGIVEYVNPYFEELTGYAESEVIGQKANILKSDQTPSSVYADLWHTISNGGIWRGELINRKKNGDLFWEMASISPIQDEKGQTTHFVAIKENITDRKRQEETILRQAYYDPVTGLPNRVLAVDRLSQAIKGAHRDRLSAGLLFIDLDDFKKVNDSLGHEKGDQILIEAAARLSSCVREGDTVARHGGDEFLIILADLQRPIDAETIAEKILQSLADPFKIDNLEIIITASIGLSFYPDDGNTPSVLLRNADTAMYRAKEDGRNTYHFFAKTLNDEAVLRLELERGLQSALENREFFLEYQPQVDPNNGRCLGAEALIRWNSPTMGRVGPDKFIPIAEQLGLIVPIGEWALREACHRAKKWIDEGNEGFKISVNVSPRQFRGYALVGAVALALGESGLPVECLEIEVTEGLMIGNRTETREILEKLNKMGVSIAMDDFGTGYSSLSYLKNYPFDKLKIDRAFVDGLENDQENQALVTAAAAMAKALGLTVVAEGVETSEQLKIVHSSGCHLIQGYYYGKPIPAHDFTEFLLKNRAPR